MNTQERLYNKMAAEYDSFIKNLMKQPPGKIIEGAYEKVFKEDLLLSIENGRFDEKEFQALLCMENPLSELYSAWLKVDDTYMTALDTCIENEARQLIHAAMEEKMPQQFMNVDLLSFLGGISDKVIIHYPRDWDIDKDSLAYRADSLDHNDKRFAWHVSSYGTHLVNEREMFIRDTGDFNYWTNYRPNDPDMFGYFIEITGREGNRIIGNVYDVGNYAEHVKHVRENALPLHTVTLVYENDWGENAGKTITVSRNEYDTDRHRLMSESGNIKNIYYHPPDESDLSARLDTERSRRAAQPIGIPDIHLEKLRITLAKIRTPQTQALSVVEAATPIQNGNSKAPASQIREPQSLSVKLQAAHDKVKAHDSNKGTSIGITKNTPEYPE